LSTIALFICLGEALELEAMATKPSGTRLAESLKRVYKELRIDDNDVECLTTNHQIWNSQDLGMNRQCLERKALVGVRDSAQIILENVAAYAGSNGVAKLPDPLANFSTKDYYEFLDERDNMDFSAATDHGEEAILGTKDDPICCDSVTSDGEEADGMVTFKKSSNKIPNIKDCKKTMIDEGVHGVVKLDADKLAPAVRAGGTGSSPLCFRSLLECQREHRSPGVSL
jgi:hypothetical protein